MTLFHFNYGIVGVKILVAIVGVLLFTESNIGNPSL